MTALLAIRKQASDELLTLFKGETQKEYNTVSNAFKRNIENMLKGSVVSSSGAATTTKKDPLQIFVTATKVLKELGCTASQPLRGQGWDETCVR